MLPAMTAYIRVVGVRNNRFVEFEFSLNDEDLTVELILPIAAFDEFCRRYDAVVLDDVVLDDGGALRDRGAGLYRRPEGDDALHPR
ncbi:MAG TPA: phenol hydroxylase subunit [Azospirillum sp.]